MKSDRTLAIVPFHRKFKLVHDSDVADFDGARVTLFAGEHHVCGWYMCPANALGDADGYVPKSANLIFSSAIMRAVKVADRLEVSVCIIDPDGLWDEAWRGG